ncbi:GlsB/YeaQ/YmgE family stress response membrane protein [Devosia sp. ZB163]|uniref:GlsB/YeaQ/YmgE family stress response membrane protein n=1 Tax=Devosia sp. ZB163 TaxID=3025938 RepID=UPI00235FA866|nr:GlsB/YeaQ/YmgE family stress response membrane protein [Devosia sp. ZB163]MDC9824020.1 GlsB/YeaQ/YmgE family stress response membrane protein [Devosia sp. ZB163]
MGIVWTLLIGLVAGIVAKLILPNSGGPSGYVMTAVLGIVGAFLASFLGQAFGLYQPGEGAGLLGAIVGAVIVLFIYGAYMRRRT